MAMANVARVDAVPNTSIRAGSWRSTLLALGLCLVVFLLIQGLLAAHTVREAHEAVASGGIRDNTFLRSLPLRARGDLLAGSLAYLSIAVAGIAVARQGHRRLFAVPAAIFILATAAQGLHVPRPIGLEWWRIGCFTESCVPPWFAHPWVGPMVDLALVLVPGWFMSRNVEPRAWPRDATPATWAAVVGVVGCLGVVVWSVGVITQRSVDAAAFASAASVGLLLGVARPWWPWMPAAFGVVVSGGSVVLVGAFMRMSESSGWSNADFALQVALPVVVIAVVATLWEPLARVGARLQAKPLQLLIAVNALNVADAVLTAIAVNAGAASEANPVVRTLGLPGKIALVGLVTWLLYKRRPSALVWPAAALLAVVAYHVAGALVNS